VPWPNSPQGARFHSLHQTSDPTSLLPAVDEEKHLSIACHWRRLRGNDPLFDRTISAGTASFAPVGKNGATAIKDTKANCMATFISMN